jgi:hypothetical protein
MNFEIAPKSTEVQATWDDARLYCFSLTVDGKTGWRLPTPDELNEIYESEHELVGSSYWSSAEVADSFACYQSMYNGGRGNARKIYSGFYVRAIRSTV